MVVIFEWKESVIKNYYFPFIFYKIQNLESVTFINIVMYSFSL